MKWVREGRRAGWGGALSGMQPSTHSCPQLAPTALPILSRTYPLHRAPGRTGISFPGAMPLSLRLPSTSSDLSPSAVLTAGGRQLGSLE